MGILKPHAGHRRGDGEIDLMRFFFVFFVSLITTSAHAQMTENAMQKFLQNHNAVFASCDPVKLKTHLETHFTPSYTITAKSTEGETRTMTRADMLQAFNQIPDDFDFSQLSAEECGLNYSVTDIKTNGNNAQFTTLEQEQFMDENNVQQTYFEKCINNATLQNNMVLVTKSNCLMGLK